MSIIGILILSVILVNLSIGFLVFLKDRKKSANQIFLGITLTAAIWTFGTLLFTKSEEIWLGLMGARIAFMGASLIAPLLLIFSLIFPKKLRVISFKKYLLILSPSLFFALISFFTPFIVKSVELKTWGYNPVYGRFYLFFALYFLIYIGLTIFNLIKQHLESSGVQKIRFKYLAVGLFISILASVITNIIIPATTGLSKFSNLGPLSIVFAIIFTGYAIFAKQLFEIRVVLVQILVGVIAILLLFQFLASATFFEYAWKGTLLVAFLIFGWLLIKSVLKEIRQREELQKAYAEVERLSKAKSEFISIASHQLRTPLTAIKGYISMILEGAYGSIVEKAKKPMESVYKSNERLIKLINDLLSVSRIESGKIELELQKSSIEEIISNIISVLKIEAEKKNLYLKWEKPAEPLPKILIDQDKIRQVILNIVDNAIKYTNKGGVTVETELKDSSCQIKVRDTGEGMSEEEISYLFESFSRGKVGTQFHTEGAGLGLYIARKFIEMHQGKIWAESPGKGKGSTFYIEVPVK